MRREPMDGGGGAGRHRPAATEAELLRRGGALADTGQVLGYDMSSGLASLGGLPGVRADIIRDEAGARAGQLGNREERSYLLTLRGTGR